MATGNGDMPISWLYNYVIGRFENTNDSFIDLCNKLISEKKIKPGLKLDDSFNAGITPDGVMIIGRPLMSSLWCMCYYGFVTYEKAVAIHQENIKNGLIDNLDRGAIEIAEKCRLYALSLKSGLFDWPNELPKPEDHERNEFVNLTNQLFLYAMNYIMCHELAHRELGHSIGLTGDKSRQQEYDADERSFELLLQGRDGNNNMTLELGILLGLCSMLMLVPNENDGITHPSSINRLKAFLQKLDPIPESQLWGMACLFLGIWDNVFKKNYDFSDSVDTYKDMFYNVVNQIK